MKAISELYLYPLYMGAGGRAAFERATGAQAPPFDPQRAPKYWFTPKGETTFVVPQAGAPDHLGSLTLDVPTAGSVNLPGPYRYEQTPFSGTLTDADMQTLAGLLGGTAGEGHGVGTASNLTWPIINVPGVAVPLIAMSLMRQWYAIGRNRPGRWGVDANLQLHLDAAPETIQAYTPPAVPVPIRPLKPTEKIVVAGIAGALFVVDSADPDSSPAGGSFRDSDRAMLLSIEGELQAIRATLDNLAGGGK